MWAPETDTEQPTGACVLVASSDPGLTEAARTELARRGFAVVLAADTREAARQLTAARTVDAVVVDMDAFSDVGFLQAVRESPARPEILALADERGLAAELAAQAGADVCHRPPNWSLAEERLRRALFARSLREQLSRVMESERGSLVGSAVGPEHADLVTRHRRAAQTSIPLLIIGAAGTPRRGVARRLHELSGRAHRPFIEVVCDRADETEVHDELFGTAERQGLLEEAAGGSVFIDDLHHLSARSQATLARVLESHAVIRGGREYPVDARLLCATPVDLRERVEAGAFRADLLYRLAGISLRLSSLAERAQEISPLCDGLLASLAGRRPRRLSVAAREALEQYTWPGNELELELVLRRALLTTEATTLEPPHLRLAGGPSVAATEGGGKVLSFEEYEANAMRAALENTGGNVTQAARVLGIGRATFYRKAKKFGIKL
jgi:DNA-binding NtrC family response regulator